MMDQHNEAVIVTDAKGKIHSISEKALQLFGLNPDEANVIEMIFPEMTARQDICMYSIARHKDGSAFLVQITKHPFFLLGTEYELLTIKDFCETREDAHTIKELLNFKSALDEAAIVAITDNRGKIEYVNDQFCKVSKYSSEELIGQDHRIINSGYHEKVFMTNLWKTISGGSVWRGEIKNKAKDGTYYWVDTTIVPFLNASGKPYRYLAIRKEITEYKRVVEELRKSIRELVDFKFALDESTIVAITNEKGKITYVNDRFCQISKYSREELIGQDHRIINSGYHPKEFIKELWGTIGKGKVWKGEIRNKAKDGTHYWVDTTIVPFKNEKGKPYQYLAIRSEITDRKRVENELKKMMAKMIHVQEEERKRLSRELHDGVGQNLYSHLITISRLHSEVDHPLLDQMQKEAADLIEEVREISWKLRPSVLDDLGLVPAIRSFLHRFSQHYKIDVSFECVLEKRLGNNAETAIYRVIQEALTNVRKYADVEHAYVSIREIDESVRILVEDEGKGFDQSNPLLGVGLFSMEERARSAGGTLTVKSAPERGTKVILEVPKK